LLRGERQNKGECSWGEEKASVGSGPAILKRYDRRKEVGEKLRHQRKSGGTKWLSAGDLGGREAKDGIARVTIEKHRKREMTNQKRDDSSIATRSLPSGRKKVREWESLPSRKSKKNVIHKRRHARPDEKLKELRQQKRREERLPGGGPERI